MIKLHLHKIRIMEKRKPHNLSHIDTLADLQHEIQLVRARIAESERNLKQEVRRLPASAAKSLGKGVVPAFMRKWKMFAKLYNEPGKKM